MHPGRPREHIRYIQANSGKPCIYGRQSCNRGTSQSTLQIYNQSQATKIQHPLGHSTRRFGGALTVLEKDSRCDLILSSPALKQCKLWKEKRKKKMLQNTWTTVFYTKCPAFSGFFSELQVFHSFFRASLNNQEGCHMQSKAGISASEANADHAGQTSATSLPVFR
jgi:hypothetical protein